MRVHVVAIVLLGCGGKSEPTSVGSGSPMPVVAEPAGTGAAAPAIDAGAGADAGPQRGEQATEGLTVAAREVTAGELRMLLGATPGEPGSALAGLAIGMRRTDAEAVPAIARWLVGTAPVPGRLTLRFHNDRLSGIDVELRGDVPALARAVWPAAVQKLDSLPLDPSVLLWRARGKRAWLVPGSDHASWRLRFSSYRFEQLDELVRPDRLQLGFESIRILGATRAELAGTFGAQLQVSGDSARLSLPPPLFSRDDALEVGLVFDPGGRVAIMCTGIDYGLFAQAQYRAGAEVARRLQRKFGPAWAAPCAEGARFTHRDVVITAEHCVPSVALNIGVAGSEPPHPPESC